MIISPVRQITLRLPEPLYLQVRQLACKRRVSINRLAQEGLETVTQDALAREVKAAYSALAMSPAESDVEAYLPAQREAAT